MAILSVFFSIFDHSAQTIFKCSRNGTQWWWGIVSWATGTCVRLGEEAGADDDELFCRYFRFFRRLIWSDAAFPLCPTFWRRNKTGAASDELLAYSPYSACRGGTSTTTPMTMTTTPGLKKRRKKETAWRNLAHNWRLFDKLVSAKSRKREKYLYIYKEANKSDQLWNHRQEHR